MQNMLIVNSLGTNGKSVARKSDSGMNQMNATLCRRSGVKVKITQPWRPYLSGPHPLAAEPKHITRTT